jgi:Ni/Fe-hydrogenase subunit HybB-like protein
VALCIAAYIVVMWIEFAPAFMDKIGLGDLKRKLSKVLFFFIALGVLLPTMHQFAGLAAGGLRLPGASAVAVRLAAAAAST